ncbi:DUF2059 domain-containing protein [Reinekea forsetii]|nr:DUF2059 domain-containing protein [Reinekea forsetii]
MKKFAMFVFILVACSFGSADERDAVEIAKSVVSGGTLLDIDENIKSIASVILERNPGYDSKRDILMASLKSAMTSEEMLMDMSAIYVEHFTREELLELEKLMESPAMVKWLKNMPTIMPQLVDAQRKYIQPAIVSALEN